MGIIAEDLAPVLWNYFRFLPWHFSRQRTTLAGKIIYCHSCILMFSDSEHGEKKYSNEEALVQKTSGLSSLVRTTNSYNLGARITFLMSLNVTDHLCYFCPNRSLSLHVLSSIIMISVPWFPPSCSGVTAPAHLIPSRRIGDIRSNPVTTSPKSQQQGSAGDEEQWDATHDQSEQVTVQEAGEEEGNQLMSS